MRGGQLFWSRSARRRRVFLVRRVEPGDRAIGEFDDATRAHFTFERLLEVRADGEGAHSQFAGFRSRPCGYNMEAVCTRCVGERRSCAPASCTRSADPRG